MFSGFKLSFNGYDESYYKQGLSLFSRYKRDAAVILEKYIGIDGSLNGTSIQSDWFPQVKADIFISHSHKDEKSAITLAGMLSEMGLTVFIDSCIWGYAPSLLKSIDDRSCMNDTRTSYIYEERNKSTSHVHMMLSAALNMMIDKTEAVFFLNTPNSVEASGVLQETVSPWIYAEIAMTRLVRKRDLSDYRPDISKSLNESVRSFSENVRIRYQLDTGHLTNLTNDDLITWRKSYDQNAFPRTFALDKLYEQLNLKITY